MEQKIDTGDEEKCLHSLKRIQTFFSECGIASKESWITQLFLPSLIACSFQSNYGIKATLIDEVKLIG